MNLERRSTRAWVSDALAHNHPPMGRTHMTQTMLRRLGLTAVVCAASALPAQAATAAPITGKLDAKGYTVLAVAPDGTTTSARTNSKGRFRLTAPGRFVTLHLRNKAGKYAGPLVVARKSKGIGLMSVKSGTALGVIDVRRGYAMVVAAPPRTRVGGKSIAFLHKGMPVGARVLGLTLAHGKVTSSSAPGSDADRDGIVNAFDVDDDGDLVLDNVDSSHDATVTSRSSASTKSIPLSEREVHIFSNLKLSLESSLNANAGAGSMSESAVDTAMSTAQTLAISIVPGDEVELDCGGLTYCSTGGTGTGLVPSGGGGSAFPTDYDADSDGYGTIEAGPTGDFQLLTGATHGNIGAGDVFIERVTAGTSSLQAPGLLNFVFTSTPAVTSWSDDDGTTNNAVTYPVAPGTAGTTSNPANVDANGDGDVVLTFTLWRPQRPRIAPFEAFWVDIGGLNYSVDIPNAPGGGAGPGLCDVSTYTESDANLSAGSDSLTDAAADADADAANTLTFAVNITDCLGATTWNVGDDLQFDLQARTSDGDNAAQKLHFHRNS